MEPLESFPQASLPDDVIFVILSKLPVKTLLRFRAVCRFWRQLISSPVFINSHLRSSQRHNSGTIRNALLDSNSILPPPPCICQGASDEKVHEFIRYFSEKAGEDHQWRLIFHGGPYTLAGCCNGLICFYKFCEYRSDIHIYLWNPALKHCRVLRESNYNGKNLSFHSIMVCLLYNSVTDDYQIVKIFYLLKSGFYKAEIYSLSTNSWKPLISEFFPNKEKHFSYLKWDAVAHNGFPHWLARCENLPTALCVLDMNKGKIHQIPLPEEVYKREDSRLELFRGSLSIFCGLIKKNAKFELWVLKEEGKAPRGTAGLVRVLVSKPNGLGSKLLTA